MAHDTGPADQPPCTRIVMEREGGHLPTLRPRVEVDCIQLPAGERSKLTALLGRVPDTPQRLARGGHPDAYTYRITLWDGSARGKTFVFGDADGHAEALDELAAWIRANKR